MKKIIGITVILLTTFILTGCGTKTVNCKKEEGKQVQIVSATFANNIVSKITTEVKTEVDENLVETASKYMETMITAYKNTTGIKASVIKENNLVGIKLEMDVAKVSENILDDIPGSSDGMKNATPKSFIEAMTEEGYTCK